MDNWYKEVESKVVLAQGDLLLNCPIARPSDSKKWDSIDIDVYDVIVMSQSCDLENKKIDLVLVCPYYTLSEFTKTNRSFEDYKLRESARQGNLAGFHLLNECPFHAMKEVLIVDFKTVFSIS